MLIFWLGVLNEDVESKIAFLRSKSLSVQHHENKHEFLSTVEDSLTQSSDQQVLAMMNFYSVSMAIDLCGSIRSFKAHNPALIFLNVESASIDQREEYFLAGGNDLIVGNCGKIELLNKISTHDNFFNHSKQNRVEIEQASQMTMLAMENSSDLGNILDFTRSVLGRRDYNVIADAVFSITQQFSPQCFVEIVGHNDTHTFSSSEDKGRFVKLSHQSRVVSEGDILQINQQYITAQLTGLPTDNPIKLGRISDNMSTLIEMANRFVEHINADKKTLQIEKLRLDFVDSMINELLTRMKVIQKFSGSMKKVPVGSPLGEKHVAALKNAYESVIKINQIILTMIDINQLKSDGNYLKSDTVNLAKLLENLVENYAPIAREKNANKLSLLKKDEYLLETNKKFLTNILCHLLDNAIKFTKQGSILLGCEVQSVQDGKMITLTIRDSGDGLPEDEVNRLLSESDQAEKNNKPGLGLTYVKLFSELLGLSLGISSQADSGTEFVLTYLEKQVTPTLEAEDFGGAELF